MGLSDFFTNESSVIVQDQMSYLRDKADEALVAMYEALNDLRDEITSADTPGGDINYTYIDDTIETDIDHLRPDPPDFPTTDDIDPPERKELIDFVLPVFPVVPTFDEDTPDDDFSYTENDYQSSLLDAVKASTLDWILNGGTGLVSDVEEAIFDRARTRLTEAWELAFDNADTFHSSRGFNIPSGPKDFKLRRVNADFERKEEDLNQEIMKIQAELAQKNTQFAHTLAVTLEQNLMTHFNAVSKRLFEAAKTTTEMIYSIFEKKVQVYLARVQATSTEIDAEAKKIDAQVSINKGIIDQNVGETTRFRAEIDAVLGVIDGLAKVYAANIQGFAADIDKARIDVDAKIERLKALTSQSRNETELAIKEWEVGLQGYLSSLGLNIEVAKTIAAILAQIAAGAMSGLNTHAGLNDATGRHFSRGETDSYSESHTYQHDA